MPEREGGAEDDAAYEARRATWVACFTERLVAIAAGRTPTSEAEVRAYAKDSGRAAWDEWRDDGTPEQAAEADFAEWEPE